MSIASYSDLQVQIMRLMDGDNLSVSDIETATVDQIISLAEKRIYREVRSRLNEKAFSGVTVTGNVAALPADFEACSTVHFGKKALEPVPDDWLRAYNQYATGEAEYFAESGGGLAFGPAVADGTAVQGRYFFRFPDLSTGTFGANTMIAREPDLFIFAALAEGAPFFGKEVQMWEAKYQAIKHRLNADKIHTAYSAGRIKIRPSTTLIG